MEYLQLIIEAPSKYEDILTALMFAHGAPGVEVEDPSIIAAHLAAEDWDASVFDGQQLATGRVVIRALFQEQVPPELYGDIAAACPPQQALLNISTVPLPMQDWQQMWRDSFPTLRIGPKLAIIPHWRKEDVPGAIPLYIAPGMAFGTGDHATTALVAELLQQYLQPGQRVLDLGCGSGILAIAALKLGAAQALAVDIDATCAPSVAEHRAINSLNEGDLPFLCGDILREAELQAVCRAFAADLLLSNIVAGVIAELAPHAANYLKPGGLWISSGILLEKEGAVQQALATNGWQVLQRCERDEWVALCCRMKEEKSI